MLSDSPVVPVLPSTDLEATKKFYSDVLGLEQAMTDLEGGLLYNAGKGTMLAIYYRPEPTRAEHTVATWIVEDIEATVDALAANGVVFESYDMPEIGLKTDERGIATGPDVGGKSAWFRDPDGNILAVGEMK